MKKVISGFLSVTLIASTLGTFPVTFESKAVTVSNNSAASVTDLNKYENNDIIVTYKKDSNATKKKTLNICGLSSTAASNAEVSKLTDNSVILKLDSNDDLETAIEALSQDNRVEYIQPNYIYRLYDTDVNSIYNSFSQNTDFAKQWGLYNDGTTTYSESSTTSFWGRPTQTTIQAIKGIDIDLMNAWSICAAPKRETVVAIVDTGVMYDHEDLAEHIWTNSDEVPGDGIDNDGNGYIDDVHGWNFYDESVYNTDYGWGNTPTTTPVEGNNTYYNKNSNIEDSHGTHGAGTIAASNNKIGTVGIASNADVKIMSVKALGGDEGYGTTESVVQGIQYAEENGAHICNLSLGGEEDDTALRSVMENSSMLFTIAAGNGDYYTGRAVNIDRYPTYPASYDFDNIITVANLQCNGNLHSSSNYGATSVDLAAPGSYVYSTSTGDGTTNSNSSIPASSSYEYMSGTSMAAPMVAGVAAMLYSCYDDLSLQDVKSLIMDSVTPLNNLSGKCISKGTLNAYAAVQLAKNGSIIQTGTPIPTASIEPTMPVMTTAPTPTIPNKTISPTPTMLPTTTPIYSIAPTKTPTITMQPTPIQTSTIEATTKPTASVVPTVTASVSPIVTNKPATPNAEPTLPVTPTTTPTTPVVPTPPQTTATPVVTKTPVYDFLTIDNLTISGGNTYYIGHDYTFTPKVSGGNGNYQYRYQISKNGKKYVNTTYSKKASIKWTPTTSGNYQIKISVKDSNGYDDYYSLQIPVAKLKIKSLKANKILRKGTTTKFTAKANSGFGTLTYKFTIKKVNSSYSRKQSSKKNIFAWKIPSKGTYKLTLQITDSKKNQIKKTYTLKVKK